MEEKQSQPPVKLPESEEEQEKVIELLEKRIEEHDNNRKAVQDKLHEICEGLRAQIDELEDRVNKELEEKFTSEDNRLQAALNELRGDGTTSALQKAKAELLVLQTYEVFVNKKKREEEKVVVVVVVEEEEVEEEDDDDDNDDDDNDDDNDNNDENDDNDENDTVNPNPGLTTLYELKTEKRFVPELMKNRKPTDVRVASVNRGRVSVGFTCFNPDEERVLSDHATVNPVKYNCLLFKKGNEQESKEEYPLDKDEDNNSSSFTFTPDILEAKTTYGTRVKMVFGDRESEWSDEIAEFTTPAFKECCVWKKCPGDVDEDMKYSVDEKNPRIATKVNSYDYCTIIANTHVPPNTVTSWSIKVRKSKNNDGDNIYIGTTPFDVNQNNDDNHKQCGWYFYCYSSKLYSGPPHNYRNKTYGPRKEDGQYVHTGDSVGIVVDTTRGDLSFVLNGTNRGVAYEGVPLDKPLVPCVLLKYEGDSVELDTPEATNVDSSIPFPSNITAKSTTWDSITLTWDEVAGTLFYQIEVDGSKSWDASTANTFTKRRLLSETEHSFRVRTVRESSVSEWSGVVKGRTLKESFETSGWKECPDGVKWTRKYSVDEKNPRIATKISSDYGYCTIIGNTHVPLNTVTSWSIKVLKSWDNDGANIYIGMGPSDIDQNEVNHNKCGWYFDCYFSELYSGPPHNYDDKEYGPRKDYGQYVHTEDSVGVVMDTTKGDLSFVLNGVNLGVAFEGIPLDKPLVPCVILRKYGDSIELIV